MARVAYLATVITYCWISATSCCSANDGEASESLQIQAAHRVQQSAVGIDFAAELQLGFPSLTSLGVRIEQARRDRDHQDVLLAGPGRADRTEKCPVAIACLPITTGYVLRSRKRSGNAKRVVDV